VTEEVRNRSNAEHYDWGGGCEGWRLLDGADLSVIEERIPPGLGEVRHRHDRARQLFFVLQGCLEIDLGGRESRLGPGDSLEMPPRQPHRVRNPFAEDARFLVISAPSTRSDRVNLADPAPR